MRLSTLRNTVVQALEDKKAKEILVLDVRKLTTLFDNVIIASGDSTRQNKALARSVHDKVKERGVQVVSVEGDEVGEWILVDLGDIVVHIMQPAVRQYYNLEELWTAKKAPRKRAAKSAAGKTEQAA